MVPNCALGTAIDIFSHSTTDVAVHLDPSYCGGCYGATPPENAKKPGCCNTCEEVREAYASVSWAFGRGEGVEQCEREHYSENLDAQRHEGCRIEGDLRVNKVVGNFHIAPGRSFSNGNMHVHDLNNYFESPIEGGHTFTHTIHHLRFGPQLPEGVAQNSKGSLLPRTNNHLNPLDQTLQSTNDPAYNYMYFIKVVSTSYLPLGHRKGILDRLVETSSDMSPLGSHGRNADGSVETHQYSVTSHKRSLGGGSDAQEGHKERLHARGGIPGVFFSYVGSLQCSGSNKQLTYAGYFAYESDQSRRALQIVCGLSDKCLRGHRRHIDSRSSNRPRPLRRCDKDQKVASAMIAMICTLGAFPEFLWKVFHFTIWNISNVQYIC